MQLTESQIPVGWELRIVHMPSSLSQRVHNSDSGWHVQLCRLCSSCGSGIREPFFKGGGDTLEGSMREAIEQYEAFAHMWPR